MEKILQKADQIDLVYAINEPAADGGYAALKAAGKEKGVLVVAVDGGCNGDQERQGRRHRRHLAAVSAADGRRRRRGDRRLRQDWQEAGQHRHRREARDRSSGSGRSLDQRRRGHEALLGLISAERSVLNRLKDTDSALVELHPRAPISRKDAEPRKRTRGSHERSVASGRPAPQEFEKVLTAASTTQASFEEEKLSSSSAFSASSMSIRPQCPSSCWCSAFCSAARSTTSHFVTGSNLSTVLTQVTIIGILGIAQTLVILTAGIDLSVGVIMVISSVVMGRLAVVDGVPRSIAFPLGLLCGARLRLAQRRAGDAPEDAAVHRHPGHAQHHRRAQHVLFAERNHSHAGHRGEGAVPAADGHSVRDRQRAHHARRASS